MNKLAVICLLLPDGRLVLQRRSKNAPAAPGKLGFFGGHIEKGEKPDAALRREIKEETSLNPDELKIKFIADYIIRADKDYPKDRHTYLSQGLVADLSFELFDGDRAEAYSIGDLLTRKDLTVGVRFMVENLWKEM
ncbi:MAG TPA: NUDIX hydrolase [Candidatus Saccharimonadales bacterium]|nr:NUDIX hydrolase [Candidatus Saccharimonadales bacterium]